MAEMQKRLGCKSEDMNMKCLKMDMNVPLEAECTIYLVIDDSKCRQIYLAATKKCSTKSFHRALTLGLHCIALL